MRGLVCSLVVACATPALAFDADGDGADGSVDVDDGDPCAPRVESGTCDQDHDGVTNGLEWFRGTDALLPDTDGDGLSDGEEREEDEDGDGRFDALDACFPASSSACYALDSDGDGISDGDDGFLDVDHDGILNRFDADDDGDGLGTRFEREDAARYGDDADGDGLPNHLDRDADGRGNPDGIEGRADEDGDLIPGYLDRWFDDAGPTCDHDGDGVGTGVELLRGLHPLVADSDHDGIGDQVDDDAAVLPPLPCFERARDLDIDADEDGDGVLNGDELLVGSDPFAADTDGDGLDDASEIGDLANPSAAVREPEVVVIGVSQGLKLRARLVVEQVVEVQVVEAEEAEGATPKAGCAAGGAPIMGVLLLLLRRRR